MDKITMVEALAKLLRGHTMQRSEARDVMTEVMEGRATPAQIGSLLTALRIRGETAEEIIGFAEIMRQKAMEVRTERVNLLDTCGTGGDGADTINISTAAAIVAAGGGIRVAKHGNRAASSKSGSADVLEALGVTIGLTAEQASDCLERIGICFMFANLYHQSMKYAAPTRKELGFRTVFNLLGPLTNPAGADRQLLGVSDRSKTEMLAGVLRELNVKRAMVVASLDGLDEISLSAPTQVTELKDGAIRTFEISPAELGLDEAPISAVKGGDAGQNAAIMRRVFGGEKGPYRDIIAANSGACFYVTGKAQTLREGVEIAARIIDSGAAEAKLEQLKQVTGELSHVSG